MNLVQMSARNLVQICLLEIQRLLVTSAASGSSGSPWSHRGAKILRKYRRISGVEEGENSWERTRTEEDQDLRAQQSCVLSGVLASLGVNNLGVKRCNELYLLM